MYNKFEPFSPLLFNKPKRPLPLPSIPSPTKTLGERIKFEAPSPSPSPKVYKVNIDATPRARRQSQTATTHTIYSLKNLQVLVAKLQAGAIPRGAEEDCIRYVVTPEGQAYFAWEGMPNAEIPAHYQMLSGSKDFAQCIAAGNIYFERVDGNLVINCINHKSGDFTPNTDSMKWLLAILFAHEETLFPKGFIPTEIGLERLNRAGGLVLPRYTYKKTDLKTELAEHIELATRIPLAEENKVVEIIPVVIAPPPLRKITSKENQEITTLTPQHGSGEIYTPNKRMRSDTDNHSPVETKRRYKGVCLFAGVEKSLATETSLLAEDSESSTTETFFLSSEGSSSSPTIRSLSLWDDDDAFLCASR